MLRRERRTPEGEMIGIRSDITAFKEQEERLRAAKRKAERAEDRLASAIEAISEGFVIYDEYDRLVMCNSAYKELRAEDADMIVPGVTFEEIVSTAVRARTLRHRGRRPGRMGAQAGRGAARRRPMSRPWCASPTGAGCCGASGARRKAR